MQTEKVDTDIELEEETEETQEAEKIDAGETASAAAERADEEKPEGEEPEATEFVVSLGDEKPEAEGQQIDAAPQWVKNLREINKRQAKELDELRKKVKPAEEPASKLRKKPTIEDHDHYADAFEADLDKWYAEKAASEREAEERKRAKQKAEEAEQSAWKEKLSAHDKKKAELPVKDYAASEETVFDLLDETQRGIVINYSDNSALLIYALGRNPAKLSDLAACKDPGAFIKAMTKLESNLKTSTRRPTTAPESRVERGSAGKPTTSAAGLEKLRAEADRTGNRTKVLEYMRAQRRAAK